MNRVALEVVAEREIAEHLEERMVSKRWPHVAEVVVFAADTHTFLRRGRPGVPAGLAPKKYVLELVHARVGEQQRGIFVGHERRARDDRVPVTSEVLEKRTTDVVRATRHDWRVSHDS